MPFVPYMVGFVVYLALIPLLGPDLAWRGGGFAFSITIAVVGRVYLYFADFEGFSARALGIGLTLMSLVNLYIGYRATQILAAE